MGAGKEGARPLILVLQMVGLNILSNFSKPYKFKEEKHLRDVRLHDFKLPNTGIQYWSSKTIILLMQEEGKVGKPFSINASGNYHKGLTCKS